MKEYNKSLESRIRKLERLLKCESDDINDKDTGSKLKRKRIQSAQHIVDVTEEILARLESLDEDFKEINLDTLELQSLRDSLSQISSEAEVWL